MEPRFTFFEANSTNGSGKPSVTLTQLRRLLDDAIKDYKRNHPRSLSIHKDALRFLPGGNTRSVLHTDPFPICMDRGEGNRLVDVDGREYVSALDFQLPIPLCSCFILTFAWAQISGSHWRDDCRSLWPLPSNHSGNHHFNRYDKGVEPGCDDRN